MNSVKAKSLQLTQYILNFIERIPKCCLVESINRESFEIAEELIKSNKSHYLNNDSQIISEIIHNLWSYNNNKNLLEKLLLIALENGFFCNYKDILRNYYITLTERMVEIFITNKEFYHIDLRKFYKDLIESNKGYDFIIKFHGVLFTHGIDLNNISALESALKRPEIVTYCLSEGRYNQESIQNAIILLTNEYCRNYPLIISLINSLDDCNALCKDGIPIWIKVIKNYPYSVFQKLKSLKDYQGVPYMIYVVLQYDVRNYEYIIRGNGFLGNRNYGFTPPIIESRINLKKAIRFGLENNYNNFLDFLDHYLNIKDMIAEIQQEMNSEDRIIIFE
ncbi:hypothetical protein TVAG_239820 [Trichomonas vaginalis G3]|uniref:Uncharacterized protein n=1 Tax=Trichomonas vaginalis (strain ATCC PRA-98 / G3) TaxID=412133 RepID=A2EFC5_TRIV3|nr:protein ubiquitination [Trichomonas vaginalis G3]EAY08622.1 hypothetical protein TVAG_239820 [Trichomonas vaginalis G3]KAI5536736.1 protein ubiquitination [Trichomonas vaginalis G3]|eukprot:XP_001320845.1 hypothetical protein [Trichomonas vaginalis G3]